MVKKPLLLENDICDKIATKLRKIQFLYIKGGRAI
jgi:hypothetical protein